MSNPDRIVDFGQLLETSGLTARISIQNTDGKRIDRSLLTGDDRPEGYILDTEDSGHARYTFSTAEDDETVVGWRRFSFPVKRKIESGDVNDVTDDLVVLIEISETGSAPETTPWDSEAELRFNSALLDNDSKFDPVNADRVAGLDDEKKRLDRFLEDGDEDWGLSESSGTILEGPPGTGKTELVMEICQEKYGSIPTMISGPEILSKWVGESEKMLREKFDEAWNTEHKVLYIDELDAIAQSRSEASESYSAQIVAQLLVLLDGVESKEQADNFDRSLKVVASTNLSHVVDPALRRPGRLGNRPIHFSRPDARGRKAILHHYLENVYVSDDGRLSETLETFVEGQELSHIDSLVEEMDGFSGADIEDLIQESVSRLPQSDHEKLTQSFLEEVIEEAEFDSGQDYFEKRFSKSELQDVRANVDFDHSPVQPAIHYVDHEDPLEAAQSYFKHIHQTDDEDRVYKLRKVSPKDFLESDSVRASEKTIQAFQHRENERIALYIENADLLSRAQQSSSLVDRLIGVLNEQFLQWDEENLLLLPSDCTDLFNTK